MARKKKQSDGTISLEEAGNELAVRLVKLYQSQTFIRSGKELAETLFKTGVEAGSMLSGIAELTSRQAKTDAANRAILKLNQVSYICKVMCMAELYRPEQTEPLVKYVGHVINALRELLNSAPEVQRVIRINSPVGVIDANRSKQPTVIINSAAPVGVVTSPVANVAGGEYPQIPVQTPAADVQVYQAPVEEVPHSEPVEEVQPYQPEDDGFGDLV